MSRFGFVGPSYASQSPNVAANRTVNWYTEKVEDDGKGPAALYPTPGLGLFCTLGSSPVLAMQECVGRLFAVSNSALWEIASDATLTNRGAIDTSGGVVSIAQGGASGGEQLLIVASHKAYSFALATNTLTDVTASLAVANPLLADFSDGYFIVLFDNSDSFQISALEDSLTWSGLDTNQVSVFPGNVVSMLVDHRELWLWGQKRSQVYYNSGAANNPFTPIPGAFIEQGCAATQSPIRLDNSVFWLGQDERGKGIAWRAQGYMPMRVSNHAVEFTWSRYPQISDAVSYSYQDQGHTFWVLYFPSIGDPSKGTGATWVYDASTGQWHERGYWNWQTTSVGLGGTYSAHRSRNHAYAFGRHLVGDWLTGSVYQMSIPYQLDNDPTGAWWFVDDAGNRIRRMRRAPHISSEQEWIFHHQMQVDLEVGLTIVPEPVNPSLYGVGLYGVGLYSSGGTGYRVPSIALRWSDDAAKTWSNEHDVLTGATGEYKKRVIWRRLGRSRDRIYELVASDPQPWRITDSYLIATPGFSPQERYAKQLGKIA